MDTRSEVLLGQLHPALVTKVRLMDVRFQAAHQGDRLLVIQGLRDFAHQAALYAQGRTAPGAIVTEAPAGHSWHEFALAADLVPQSLEAVSGWSPASPLWLEIAQLAATVGLVSGSCWHHQDLPHVQAPGRFPVSPDDEVREIYEAGGIAAVWASSGLPNA